MTHPGFCKDEFGNTLSESQCHNKLMAEKNRNNKNTTESDRLIKNLRNELEPSK